MVGEGGRRDVLLRLELTVLLGLELVVGMLLHVRGLLFLLSRLPGKAIFFGHRLPYHRGCFRDFGLSPGIGLY